jgi:multidrug efflux pump subunit AcrB
MSDAAVGLGICLMLIYLTLAWVFSSWLRPLVVMSVIPFGLIGVIYGHLSWGIAMSMFSIVGVIGMAGIIINDSIVLVTTVDQYAQGSRAVAVDCGCNLRPFAPSAADNTDHGSGPGTACCSKTQPKLRF